MKIKSLNIQDYRGLSNVSIDNFDDNLNLIIGVNGAGKSSLLNAIALLLSVFTSRLSTAKSSGNMIPIEDIQRGSKKGCRISLSLDSNVAWSKFRSKAMEKKEESDLDKLNEFTKPLREQLDNQEQISLPIIVHYGVRRSVTDIPLKLSKNEDQSPKATYKDWLDSSASYRGIFPWLRAEEDYENELIRDDANARDRGLEAIRKAMQIVFPEYSDMRVKRKPHQEVVLKKNGEELPLSQLSDGEKCYIALVCDIVRRLSLANPTGDILAGDGIVLIDEVDLHLHPSWEQSVMVKLHQTFPNIQFIVSAHSPLVASHFDGTILAIDKGNVTQLPTLLGLDYSRILQDFMATSPDNKELTSLMDLYHSYKKYNMKNQADAVLEKIKNRFKDQLDSPFLESIKDELV